MRWLAVLAALVVGVAACGSDGEETSASEVQSPIAEFLGQPTGDIDSEETRARVVEQEQARQEAIAACMQNEGFDYVPYTLDESSFFVGADSELEWGSDEWAAKYGFGITTQWFSQDEVGPDLVGYDDQTVVTPTDTPTEDPNQAIVDGLSDTERDAYYAALYGEPDERPAIDPTMSEEEMEEAAEGVVWEPSGCEGEAMADDPSFNFYTEFSDELDEMYERIENDPRIAEAEQDVAECVAEQGLDYTDSEGVYERFQTDLQEIESTIGFPGDDLSPEEVEAMTDAEREERFNQPREIPDDALSRLAELQEEEITLAVAVNDCGGGFENQQKLYTEVSAEHEQQFLDEHEGELEEFDTGS